MIYYTTRILYDFITNILYERSVKENKQINRTLSLLLSVVMVLSLCPLISKAEGTKPNIKIGDYIKLGTYENEPILWRCVDIDDNGPPNAYG